MGLNSDWCLHTHTHTSNYLYFHPKYTSSFQVFTYLMKKYTFKKNNKHFKLLSHQISADLGKSYPKSFQVPVRAHDLAYFVTNLTETFRFPPGPAGRSMVNWSRLNWSITLWAGEEGAPQCRLIGRVERREMGEKPQNIMLKMEGDFCR